MRRHARAKTAQRGIATNRAMSGVESGGSRRGAWPARREGGSGNMLRSGQRAGNGHRDGDERERGGGRGRHRGLVGKQGAVPTGGEAIGVKMRRGSRFLRRRRRAQNAGGIGRCRVGGAHQLAGDRHDHDEPHGEQGKPYRKTSTGGGGKRHPRIVTHERQIVRQRRQRKSRAGETFRRSHTQRLSAAVLRLAPPRCAWTVAARCGPSGRWDGG